LDGDDQEGEAGTASVGVEEEEVEGEASELRYWSESNEEMLGNANPALAQRDGNHDDGKDQKNSGENLGQNSDKSVRFRRHEEVVGCSRKRKEKGEGLTRNTLMVTERTEQVRGGRKPRRCVAGEAENDDLGVDFVADWRRTRVEELQRDEEKLVVALVQRKVVGHDGRR
jgi:hypothetical protein